MAEAQTAGANDQGTCNIIDRAGLSSFEACIMLAFMPYTLALAMFSVLADVDVAP